MSYTIDARGLACPGPVIETRKALTKTDAASLTVIVDNDAAVENVGRMARSLDCEVKMESFRENEYRLLLTRKGTVVDLPDEPEDNKTQSCLLPPKIAVLIASDTLGRGNDDLGRLLMIAFVKTLKELAPKPNAILLMNSGVKLAIKDSQMASALQELESMKVEIFVCGTCLDFFNLKDSLTVGKISNMFEISSQMVAADRVLRP